MLRSLLLMVVDNAVAATLLGGVVDGVACRLRRPAAVHALWVLVLLKLLTPPVVTLPWTELAGLNELGEIAVPWTRNDSHAGPASTGSTFPRDIESSGNSAVVADATLDRAAPSPIPVTSLRWDVALASCWLAMTFAWLVLVAVRIARFHRTVRWAEPAGAAVQELARAVGRQLGYAPRLDVRVAEGHFPLLLWFVGSPTVLLPRHVVDQLDVLELRGILAHEVAHLVRRDHWVRWLEVVVCGCYWWHPLTWWSRARLRDAEEEACDARVVSALPGCAVCYAQSLLKVTDLISGGVGAVPMLASGLFGQRGALQRRIAGIVGRPRPCRVGRLGWATLMLAALALPVSLRADRAEPVDLATVLKALAQREVDIRSLSVAMQWESTNHFRDQQGNPPPKGILEDDAFDVTSNYAGSCIVEATGKGWAKYAGVQKTLTSDGRNLVHQRQFEMSFDGTSGRLLEATTRDDGVVRREGSTTHRLETPAMDSPFTFTTRCLNQQPFSQMLVERRAAIVGREEWERNTVVVVETDARPVPPQSQEYKTQLWVDPAYGYAVSRMLIFVRYGADRPWRLHYRLDCAQFAEVAEGIWLPGRVEVKNFGVTTQEPKQQLRLCYRMIGRFSDWKVNPETPEATFQIELPAGVPIAD